MPTLQDTNGLDPESDQTFEGLEQGIANLRVLDWTLHLVLDAEITDDSIHGEFDTFMPSPQIFEQVSTFNRRLTSWSVALPHHDGIIDNESDLAHR